MILSARQNDVLTEVINIGMGRSAAVLNTMLKSHVTLQAPLLRVLNLKEYLEQLDSLGSDRLSAVQLGYQGTFSGVAQLVFPTTVAARLVTMLTGEDHEADDFDLIQAGTLSEVGNIVINGVMGTISHMLGQHFVYAVPTYVEERADHLLATPGGGDGITMLLARTRFALATDSIDGDLLLVFKVDALNIMLQAMGEMTVHE